MNISSIYRDETLYGHTLVSLPKKVFDFSQGEFCLFERPDPGTYVVEKNYFFAKKVHYCKGQTFVFRTEIILEKPICDSIEFVGRRVLGTCAAGISCFTMIPIGFLLKVLHFNVRQFSIDIASTDLAKRVSQIWDNADLFGHVLTSSPSKYYQIASASLSWHLRADGTDRRTRIFSCGPNGTTIRPSEYELVPFELFEWIYRRGIIGTLMVASIVSSPIGLAAKCIQLAARSLFSQ